MKTYNTIEEVEKDIVDNVLTIHGDVHFTMPLLKLNASIVVKAWNIEAGNIEAWNIEAGNIEALNIEAGNIEAWNIEALNIKAGNIEAWNIEALNIKAGNIEAWNIKAGNIEALNIEAWDISFYAVCWSYSSLKCKSIAGRRDNSKYFCLDNEVEIIKEPDVTEMTVAEISKALGKTIKIVE